MVFLKSEIKVPSSSEVYLLWLLSVLSTEKPLEFSFSSHSDLFQTPRCHTSSKCNLVFHKRIKRDPLQIPNFFLCVCLSSPVFCLINFCPPLAAPNHHKKICLPSNTVCLYFSMSPLRKCLQIGSWGKCGHYLTCVLFLRLCTVCAWQNHFIAVYGWGVSQYLLVPIGYNHNFFPFSVKKNTYLGIVAYSFFKALSCFI